MIVTMYGIPNCDTIKKARQWLQENGIDYEFHDYKKAGIDAGKLKTWCSLVGLEKILNQRGNTWRKIPDAEKQHLDLHKAIVLMQEQPSLIKRPVLEAKDLVLVGFSPESYQSLL